MLFMVGKIYNSKLLSQLVVFVSHAHCCKMLKLLL